MALTVTKGTLIGEMLEADLGIGYVLMNAGMHCVGCPASQMESLEEACYVHGMNPDLVLEQINKYLEEKEAAEK